MILRACAVLLAVLLTGCGADDRVREAPASSAATSCPTTAPRVADTVRVDRAVTRLAAAEDAVWGAEGRSGELVRVDTTAGRVTGTVDAGRTASDLVVAFDGVWMADRDAGRVVWIDPAELRTRALGAYGAPVALAAVGERDLWVLSLDDAALYIVDGPTRTAFGTDFPLPVSAPGALAALGANVWVLGYGDRQLLPFASDERRLVREGVPVGESVADLATGNGDVWVAHPEGSAIVRVQPDTLARFLVPLPVRPARIAVDTCGLWAMDAEGRVVHLPFGATEPAGRPLRVGGPGGDLVAVEGGAWVSDPEAGTLTRLSVR